MRSGDFLHAVYGGVLDRTIFDSYDRPRDDDAIRNVLQKYTDILKEYPARDLEEAGRIPDEMLRMMGDAGLFGMAVPEKYEGLGLSLRDQLKIVEDVSATDMSAALVFLAHMFIGIKGIELYGTEGQKAYYLPPAASGEMIFAFALTEPNIGSDARHIETRADLSPDGTHYILNGVKTYITNANYAGAMTVFAQMNPETPGVMGAFVVETSTKGIVIGRDMPKMGLKSSSTAMVRFTDVKVPKENLLGSPGEGYSIAMTVLNYGRLGLMAASSGLTRQSVRDMRARAKSRVQFGVPVETFPLIQEKIVRARVHGFIMEAMNYFSAGLLEGDPDHNPVVETSHCKFYGTTRAWDTLYDALQVAGGAGFLATQPYEKRMRDFRVTTIFEGTTEIHSLYPTLFAIGRLGRELAAKKVPDRWIFLTREFLVTWTKMNWPVGFDDKILKRAVRLAKANARTIKRMLLWGVVAYGRKVGEREFFLRRVTSLSVHLYGILCALAKISADRRAGQDTTEDIILLEYFLEEVREDRQRNRRLNDTRRDALTGHIFRMLP